MTTLKEILNIVLFKLGDNQVVTLAGLLTALAIAFGGWALMRGVDRFVVARLGARFISSQASLNVIRRLVRYVFVAFTFAIALHAVGIDLGALFTAGAIFAVGLGFAMQNIAQNFVSGVILLAERSIKPGDILKVEGTMVQVEEMGIRSTIARTREEEQLIIPNSILAQSVVTNYKLHDTLLRLRCHVGVVYRSDMKQVRAVLEDVGANLKSRSKRVDPKVLLVDFGDSAVVWELSVWIDDPWQEKPLRSEFLEGIWFAFQEAGIVIAFPQVDVHFDAPVEESLKGLKRLAG